MPNSTRRMDATPTNPLAGLPPVIAEQYQNACYVLVASLTVSNCNYPLYLILKLFCRDRHMSMTGSFQVQRSNQCSRGTGYGGATPSTGSPGASIEYVCRWSGTYATRSALRHSYFYLLSPSLPSHPTASAGCSSSARVSSPCSRPRQLRSSFCCACAPYTRTQAPSRRHLVAFGSS